MKIAVSSVGDSINDLMSDKFGRCNYFIIFNKKTKEFEAVPNLSKDVSGGAGPKAAELIISRGVKVLLTGHVGDKASNVLKKAEIKVTDCFSNNLKVKDAVANFLKD